MFPIAAFHMIIFSVTHNTENQQLALSIQELLEYF